MASGTILIDTDIAVDIWRQFPPALRWVTSLRRDLSFLMTGYSAMEMIAGCRNAIEMRSLLAFLEPLGTVWLREDGCRRATGLLTQFRLSHGASVLDSMIAQTALDQGLPLHTFNVKHYRFVPGLVTVQPYMKNPTSNN